jgi:UDP-GlcNAc:undecaprenyl-phosphate/decaprenyl-phosphate GlcNAc-1-phosphate transferase
MAWSWLIASLISVAACGVVRVWALRIGAVVYPRNDRWHQSPRPLLGGLGIVIGTIAGLLAVAGWPSHDTQIVVGAALAMHVVGLTDDRVSLSPLAKLVASLACGALVVFGLVVVNDIRPSAPLVLLLVVAYGAICHALNLLDNMDGLAGGIGLIAALWLAIAAGDLLSGGMVMLLLALSGSLAGFLVWNVHPARLFMGDSGSLFIGAVLVGGALVPMLRPDAAIAPAALTAGLVLAVPLFDTSFVLVLRRLAGRSATRGGTDHVSHRLVSFGFSQRQAVAGLWAIAALGGALATMLRFGSAGTAGPLIALFVTALILLGVYLARVPAYDGEDFARMREGVLAPIVKDLTFRWHAGEVLLDAVLIAACYYAAYRLRFEDEQLGTFLQSFSISLPVVIACKLAALYASGLYARMWGTFGLRDISTVVRGVLLGSLLSVLVIAYGYRFQGFSRGVFVIDAALFLLAVFGSRASFRLFETAAWTRRESNRRILVYGAGRRGQLLVREMFANPDWHMVPAGFLDDAPYMTHRRLVGVPVRGGLADLDRVLGTLRIDEVVISTVAIEGELEARIREICQRHEVGVKRFFLEIR